MFSVRCTVSRCLTAVFALVLVGVAGTATAEQVEGSRSARPLITQQVSGAKMSALHESASTVARGAKDLGPVSPDQELNMRLVLARTPEQQAALEQFNAATRTPGSDMFAKSLTAAEFTETFGVSSDDMQKMTAWLESKGFAVVEANGGIGHITFTGTAAQASAAFGTQLHNFVSKNGSQRFAPATAVKVPAALSAAILRVEGLQNFVPEPVGGYDGPVSGGAGKAIPAQASAEEIGVRNGRESWFSPMPIGGLKSMRDGVRTSHANNLYNVTTTVAVAPTTAVTFGSGSSYTLTTTLAWTGGPGPTGTLTLSDSGNTLNTSINVTSCTAGTNQYTCTYNWTTASAAAGGSPDTITASYGGDSNYATSTGSTTLAVNYASGTGTPSALSLTNAPNTVNQGATTQQTFTFIIQGTRGEGTPTGTVMLYGSGAIGQIATFTLNTTNCTSPATREYSCAVKWNPSATLPAGSYQLAAAYSGNTKIASYITVDTTNFTVVASGTTATTTTVSANPSTLYNTGEGTTFTVHVTWSGSGQPTGSIQLTGPSGTLGGGPIGGAVLPASGQTSSSGSGTYYFGQYTYNYTCSYAANNITCTIVDSDVYDVLPNTSNTITAAYSGDTNFKGSSGTTTITLSAGDGFPTSTTVAASPTSAQYGAGTTITYTVDILDEFGADTQPTGTVTLSGTPVTGGSQTLTVSASSCPYTYSSATATGLAVCTLTSAVPVGTEPGSYTITAAYSGDGVYASSSGTTSFTVTGNTPTSTSVTATPTNPGAASTITFTSVTAWTGTGATPTGTVSLSCGAGSVGQCTALPTPVNVSSCTVSTTNKTFTCTLTYAAGNVTQYGSYNFVVTYSGDTNYAGSSGSTIIGVGGGGTSTTTLVTGANPSANYGATGTQSWSVNVVGSAGNGAPTGTVNVSINGSIGQVGSATISSTCTTTGTGSNKVYTCPASGTYSTSTIPAGSYTLTFAYTGSSTYNGSSATTTLTINADATSTAVSANPTTIAATGSTTVTATVTNTTVAAATAQGTVNFTVGSGTTVVASCTLSAGTCNATVSGSSLSSGSNIIKGTYVPSPSNWTASSGTATVMVGGDTTTTTVTATPSSISLSGSTTLKATVADTTNSSNTPAGSVAFTKGGTSLGSCTLSGGSCSVTASGSTLGIGTDTVTATYTPGSGSWKTSSGTTTVSVGADITFSSVSHNMGSVAVGTATPVYGVYMTNNSPYCVTFTLTLSNTTAGFTESSYKALYPGTSTELNFGFTPKAAGAVSTTWSLTSAYASSIPSGNAPTTGTCPTVPSNPPTIVYGPSNGGTLTGTGVAAGQLTITTNGHNFGTVAVGTTSAVFGAVITNSTASSVTLSVGSTTAPFNVYLNNCPATLASGASCNLQWTFTPTSTTGVSEYVPITASQTLYFGSTAVTSMYLAGN